MMSNILRIYSRLLARHKYTVQIATGGLLWFSGDLLCQSLVHISPKSKKEEEKKTISNDSFNYCNTLSNFKIDWNRTMRMTLYGICFSAPAYAFWYSWLERYSQKLFSGPPGTALPLWWRRLGISMDSAHLRTWKIIGFKLAMDTFVFDPLYLSLFFTATSVMEGKGLGEVRQKLKSELAKTWLIDIAVWSPIQTLNFRFVPVLYQALIVQSCNIGWNAYLSFVQHNH